MVEDIKVDISEKVKEAETYRSMGLLEESILIYEEFLSSEKALEDTTRNQFQSTIDDIRKELKDLEKGEENAVTEEEIAIIKDALSSANDVPQILDSASAFMELGLYKDALAEYEKLFADESAWQDVLEELATCLLKCCGPTEILKTVQETVKKSGIKNQHKAEIQFRLGLEMQNRDLKVLAQELCSSANEFDPNNEKIKEWLDSNSSRQQILSKYDHLIIHKKIIPKQYSFNFRLCGSKKRKMVVFPPYMKNTLQNFKPEIRNKF